MKPSNVVRYVNSDGTLTVRGLELFRSLQMGGGGGGATDLSYNDTTRLLSSSTGTDVTLPLVGANAGLMTAADKAKLDGIATAATANASDASLRDRATHTGAQAIATVTGLQAALDGKAALAHTHALADLTQSGATNGQVPAWNGTAWVPQTPSSGGGSPLIGWFI
jgi:hypothetical protein